MNLTRARQEKEVRYSGKENFEHTLPPDTLHAAGKILWNKIVAQHASIGLNFPSHYEYLETYCRMHEVREDTWIDLKSGKFYIDDKGIERVKASWKVHTEAIRLMHEIGAKLGLTAADKTRISQNILSDPNADKNNQKRISVTGQRPSDE